ncbi:MAG: tetratricopeptide repeat protein [Acidobacteria bacterium]|nr:tetratricopeptide repeat protein [Acidobacteriota bacterium]
MKRKHIYSFITIGLVCIFAVSCAKRAESESISTAVSPATINENLAKSAALFKDRTDLAKLREAVRLLAAARDPNQRNYEVEWKFAKYNYFLGKQTDNEKERDRAFEDGEQAGRIASRIAADKPDGFFWYAANLGEQSKISPVTVGAKSVDDIREAMQKVIAIDPKYQNSSAYDALAQVELSTAGMLGGKPEKAVEYLEQALKIEDDNSYIHLHLAEAYLATGKRDEAKKQLEFVLKMKPNPEYLPEYQETAEKAKKMLESKF